MPKTQIPFNIMVFPNGPICNLNCDYCYYKNKVELYPDVNNFQMTEELLEVYIKQYIEAQPGPMIQFCWQGGEPTLRGLDFFKKAVKIQKKLLPENWLCQNVLQTNGTLLTDEWCEFLSENNFLVGISIDGPADLHDVYRKYKNGEPSNKKVIQGLKLLQKYKVEYNVLCVVNNVNVQQPLKVYNFFKDIGVKHIQFIPLVEHFGDGKVSMRTVNPNDYGQFLINIFNEWVCKDLGNVFVQIFEECVGAWGGFGINLCVFSKTCGLGPVMEYNGDLYSCDHFVFPKNKLGNIEETHLGELVTLKQQTEFGQAKRTKMPKDCLECDVQFICNGGCLKNRIVDVGEGEEKLKNYLCAGYKQFFHYIDSYMKEISKSLKQREAFSVMQNRLLAVHDSIWNDVGRNDLCPCGSGKKFKKCCLELK